MNLSEDHRLPFILAEFSRLKVNLAGLSEVRRPDSSEIGGGRIHLLLAWRGQYKASHGCACSHLQQADSDVVKVTDYEHIMRLRMIHSLGFRSVYGLGICMNIK